MYHFCCLFKESHTGRKTRNSTFKLGYSWSLLNPGRISWFFITIHLTDFLMEWTGLFLWRPQGREVGLPKSLIAVIWWVKNGFLFNMNWGSPGYFFFFSWLLFCKTWTKGREQECSYKVCLFTLRQAKRNSQAQEADLQSQAWVLLSREPNPSTCSREVSSFNPQGASSVAP